jgi:hypothetical protein
VEGVGFGHETQHSGKDSNFLTYSSLLRGYNLF